MDVARFFSSSMECALPVYFLEHLGLWPFLVTYESEGRDQEGGDLAPDNGVL